MSEVSEYREPIRWTPAIEPFRDEINALQAEMQADLAARVQRFQVDLKAVLGDDVGDGIRVELNWSWRLEER